MDRTSALFLASFFSITIALDIAAGIYMVRWDNTVNVLQFIILQFVNFGAAYGLTELVMIAFIREKRFPMLRSLANKPPVAVLYMAYNDVMPEAFPALRSQTYSNCKVFILDDSTDEKSREVADSSGFAVIRRKERKGFKAGAINNWLSKYGRKYKYFIILDSDSMVKADFVANMVRYAEHPENSGVAVFQSVIGIWGKGTRFSRILSKMVPVWNYGIVKLSNSFSTNLTWGHNCLCRTDIVMSVGGFQERFVAEDFATTLRIIEKGHRCCVVGEESFETMPNDPAAYVKRTVRWCRGITEIMKSSEAEKIPFTTKLYLVMSMYSYMVWFFYVPGMLIATMGYESTAGNVANLAGFIATGEFLHTPLMPVMLLVFFYMFYFLLVKVPVALKAGVSLRDYFKSLVLLTSLGLYMVFPILKAQLSVMLGRKSAFEVTPKSGRSVSFCEILNGMKFSIILVALLIIGIMRNPVSLVFNFFWLAPFVLSPFVLYIACRDGK